MERQPFQSRGRIVAGALQNDGAGQFQLSCGPHTPADKIKCENGRLIEFDDIKDLDKHTGSMRVSVASTRGRAASRFSISTTRCSAAISMLIRLTQTVYSDGLVGMDDTFGKIIDKREETGEFENTLVHFQSRIVKSL